MRALKSNQICFRRWDIHPTGHIIRPFQKVSIMENGTYLEWKGLERHKHQMQGIVPTGSQLGKKVVNDILETIQKFFIWTVSNYIKELLLTLWGMIILNWLYRKWWYVFFFEVSTEEIRERMWGYLQFTLKWFSYNTTKITHRESEIKQIWQNVNTGTW